jgi:hypothetical protein
MSILLAIAKSHEGRRIRSLRAASAREEGTSPIVGEWDGSETASAASDEDPGEGRMNAAVPMRWDLNLRLEHELQTAMGAAAQGAAAIGKLADSITTIYRQR